MEYAEGCDFINHEVAGRISSEEMPSTTESLRRDAAKMFGVQRHLCGTCALRSAPPETVSAVDLRFDLAIPRRCHRTRFVNSAVNAFLVMRHVQHLRTTGTHGLRQRKHHSRLVQILLVTSA